MIIDQGALSRSIALALFGVHCAGWGRAIAALAVRLLVCSVIVQDRYTLALAA